MLIDSLRKMVMPRLIFNSMFNPMARFLLDMDKDKFEILLGLANEHIDAMAEKIRIESNGHASMGKRNCDNIAISVMEKKCLELYPKECEEIMKHTVRSVFSDSI